MVEAGIEQQVCLGLYRFHEAGVTTATVVAIPLIDEDGDAEILSVQLIDGEGFELDPDNNSFTATITDEPIVSFSGTPEILSEQQQTQHFATFNLTAPLSRNLVEKNVETLQTERLYKGLPENNKLKKWNAPYYSLIGRALG